MATYNMRIIVFKKLQYNAPNRVQERRLSFGRSPSGTMQVKRVNIPGYLGLEYDIPQGKQKEYHPDPNAFYNRAERVHYLPDTVEGLRMILRLQYAFLNGLCFDVEQSGRVVWSLGLSQQHEHISNSLYLSILSQLMTQLSIPDAQTCFQWIYQTSIPLELIPSGNFSAAAPAIAQEQAPPHWEVLHFDANELSSIANVYNRCSQHLKPVLICQEVEKEECPICFVSMEPTQEAATTDIVCIKECRHRFHKDCILEWFARTRTCPYCRRSVDISPEPFGQPSGSMRITIDRGRFCQGSEHISHGIIEICYIMPGGIQLDSMENPGQRYSGIMRIAFLPFNESGRKLLKRLKYAFNRGLTFRVGTSLTTGRSNQTTWDAIPHKTSLVSGKFGYPDPNFFTNCNESLDVLRVPKAEDCA